MTLKIGGEAGFGIMSSGTMLARAFSRVGYHVFATNEYPSLIRGGHNLITVRIATAPFAALNRDVHILVALNRETVELHKNELSNTAVIMYDTKEGSLDGGLPIPFTDIVRTHNGEQVMRNTVALGACVAILGADFEVLGSVIRDQFARKGEEMVNQNLAIAQAGFDHAKKLNGNLEAMKLGPAIKKGDQLVMNGSEAVGVGAVRAGLKFAAIYPMTPINSLITFLADHAKPLNLVYKQPEDEISGINMAIGASVAGVRSMVATSGGGFALQVEGLSLAGMVEAPLVIDMGMRVGPATGMPTWTEQGELRFVIHAGHGEFARIVLAPSDAEEAYRLTISAFNLADRYQVPVFVLTDKYLNESLWCVPEGNLKGDITIDRGKLVKREELPSDDSFKRYQYTDDGVSPRSLPGMPRGQYFANSYEHDETGHVTEIAEKRTAMAKKRLAKFASIAKDIMPPVVYGEKSAEITFVTWGTSKGPVLEATRGISANVVYFPWLYPFPTEETKALLGSAKRIIDVEQNGTGQLASLIREHTGIEIKEKILKFDGRPFYPDEIWQH
ncbi:2-oxoacid:acceptor oxidoreductase subunit alpha [Candidatus Gottesmanbacteria bacterium]|nr:2-oxoacid:acceptor oxidoreductase subunit alpha [Candidatus Gottesmanbacteria bacterium]